MVVEEPADDRLALVTQDSSEPAPLEIKVVEAAVTVSDETEVTVQRELLVSARSLLNGGYPAAAVVAAQTAAEVFVERTLAELFRLRGIDHLWSEIGEFITSYNIARRDGRLRQLYSTLANDPDIAQQPFWSDLTDHVKLRNKIVHDGIDATSQEARNSYAAVDALMNYVNGILTRERSRP